MGTLIQSSPRIIAAVALTMLMPGPTNAQVRINSRAIEFTLTGRVHLQYWTTSVDRPRSAEFLLRRARFTADAKINDFVDGRVQPDFGAGRLSLKDAYLRLTFDPAFRVSFGQFKRAFDIFELYSSTQVLTIERSGHVPGVEACAFLVCSWGTLSVALRYSERDIGVLVDGRALGKLDYRLSLTNGTGANRPDENGTKSYAGRAVVQASSDVRIGANFSVHDYLGPAMEDAYALAVGTDFEIGRYGDRFHLQAALMTGENWIDLDGNGDPSTFVSAQGIVSYIFPVESDRGFSGIEPHFRLSWADPNTDAALAGGWLITPGVALRLTGRNKLLVNIDVWSPATGDTEWSFKFQSNLHF